MILSFIAIILSIIESQVLLLLLALTLLVIGAAVVAGAILIFSLTPIASWLRPENLRSLQEQAGVFAPLGFIIIYSIATVLAVPGTILTLSAGALFGPLLGTLWTVFGATLGATAAFLVARFVAGDGARAQFEKGDRPSQTASGN